MLRRKASVPVYGVHGNESRKKGEGRIRYEEVGGKGTPRRKNSMCESPEEDRAWFPRKCGDKRVQDQIFKRPQHLETGQRKELMKEAKKGWSGRWIKTRRIWYHRYYEKT